MQAGNPDDGAGINLATLAGHVVEALSHSNHSAYLDAGQEGGTISRVRVLLVAPSAVLLMDGTDLGHQRGCKPWLGPQA